MSNVSIGDLVRRLRRELEEEPWEDAISADIAYNDTTVPVGSGGGWAEGDIGEFNDDSFEQFRVSIGGSSILTVRRGHNDTTTVHHDSGTVVLKNPRVPGWMLVNTLEETCAELWPWCWSVQETTITPALNQQYYTMPADFIDLISVTQQQAGAVTSYVNYGGRGSSLPVGLATGLPASVGSGRSLRLTDLDNVVYDITIRYRSLLSLEDAQDGLMASALVWGAMNKLALSADTRLIRQTIAQNSVSGLQQSLGYYQRFDEVRRQLHLQMMRTSPPARQYVG